MKICASINDILRKKDKVNKDNLSFQINSENNYKDKYIQKLIFNKKVENKITSERKKLLQKQIDLYKRNIYNNNTVKNHKYILKRSQSVADFSNCEKLKGPFELYCNKQNKGGRIDKKISYINKNINNLLDLSNYNNYRNNKEYLNIFIPKKNKNRENKKILSQFNNIQPYNSQDTKKNKNKENNKNIYITKYIYNINNNIKKFFNRSFNRTYINTKININEVYRNLKFFKLCKNIKNSNLINLKQYINVNNKNRKSHSVFNENNQICENEQFSLKNIFKKNNDLKNKIILIRQSNENFSMKNYKVKTFDKLCPIDSIILNFSPAFKNKKSFSNNYAICSNQVEYNIVKEPLTKKDLKKNDTQ